MWNKRVHPTSVKCCIFPRVRPTPATTGERKSSNVVTGSWRGRSRNRAGAGAGAGGLTNIFAYASLQTRSAAGVTCRAFGFGSSNDVDKQTIESLQGNLDESKAEVKALMEQMENMRAELAKVQQQSGGGGGVGIEEGATTAATTLVKESASQATSSIPLGESGDTLLNSPASSAIEEAVKAAVPDVNSAIEATAGAAQRVDASQQILVSILSTISFVLLGVLTIGVGYLSYKSWQDDKAAKNEAASLGLFGGQMKDPKLQKDGKPTLSKIGKGFAKKR